MNITISPRDNSSITKELQFELGKYTIFAGENNAGKTNLIEALKEQLPQDKVIYIPAESIKVEEHVKTGAKEDPMRAALLKLIDVTVNQLPEVNYDFIQSFLGRISETFDSFKVKNMELKLGVKKLTADDVKKIIKDEVSKKILNSVIKDKYGSGCELKLEEVGQGTQRLIIAAILQELSKTEAGSDEMFLIFEEPEIYLHPRLKNSLHKALLNITSGSIRVIVTTHDPYFVELGADQKIHNVIRDIDGATSIESFSDKALDYESFPEVNYLIFGVASTDYLLQLYQSAEEEKIADFKDHQINSIALSDIRAALAHRTTSTGWKNAKQPDVTEDMKREAIDYLRGVLI